QLGFGRVRLNQHDRGANDLVHERRGGRGRRYLSERFRDNRLNIVIGEGLWSWEKRVVEPERDKGCQDTRNKGGSLSQKDPYLGLHVLPIAGRPAGSPSSQPIHLTMYLLAAIKQLRPDAPHNN